MEVERRRDVNVDTTIHTCMRLSKREKTEAEVID